MNAEIVEMEQAHVAGVAELERECFESPWSEKGIAAELHEKTARFYVCVQADGAGRESVLGYIGSHISADECYIANLAVKKSARRRGAGAALLERLADQAEREGCRLVSLEVRSSNDAAKRLYEKSGFVKVGERRGFYTGPREDAEIYTKRLVEY